MHRTRVIRWLRLSASALCLIVCGLLIVLWVRSYYQTDSVYLMRTHSYHNIRSVYGTLTILKLIQPSPKNGETGVNPVACGLYLA